VVTGVSPTSGPGTGGTLVTITGTGLTGATVVDFGTTAATDVTVVSSTKITADSPAGGGVVDVTVTTPGGKSATSSADEFTYVGSPVVTGVSPTSGPAAGGTLVTITGTGLTGATVVDFGTTAATDVTVVNSTTVTADSPAGSGVVDVTVTTPGGKSGTSAADEFTYIVAPVVTGLSPAGGPVAGGTLVTITGTGFTGATAVDFGTTAATDVTVVSSTKITANSPAGSGVVDITVTTPEGKSATSAADEFTYQVALTPTAVLDNGAWGYTSRGLWTTNTGGYGDTYLTTAPATSATFAQWRLAVPAGEYAVWATWVASSADADNAPYQVSDNASVLGTVLENQKQAPFAGTYGGVYWVDLGNFTFNSGMAYIRLSANANGNLAADAVMLVPSDPLDAVIGGDGSNGIGTSILIGPAPAPTTAAIAPAAQKPSISVAVPVRLVALPSVTRNRVVTSQKGITNSPSLVASLVVSPESSPGQNTTLGSLEDIIGQLAADVILAGKVKK
jgi:hypothetical protein